MTNRSITSDSSWWDDELQPGCCGQSINQPAYSGLKVFLVRKVIGPDAGQLYAMKVLKKASLKGKLTFVLRQFILDFMQCLLEQI